MPWKPRVSLIMPVYNGQTYLAAAIESILSQSLENFELICVDDGSSDRSPRLLAQAAARDRRVRVITQERNQGLPAALNRGFAEAIGHFHSWTSDDNILRPEMLQTLVEALERHPDCDIVYAGYTVIDGEGRVLRYQPPRPPEDLLFTNTVGAAFLYRKRVTEALGGYDEALFGAEDYDFWLRAAHKFRMMPVNRDLYLYRRHAASLTDKRMQRIKSMVARLILRETALVGEPSLKARVLLAQLTDDITTFRYRLLVEAVKAHRWTVLTAVPMLTRHLARMAWYRLRNRPQGSQT